MTRIIQNSLVTLCLLLCTGMHAQSFKNRAALGSMNKTGFYSITVTPELSSYIKTDFSDLRVLDAEGKQAAYVCEPVRLSFAHDSSVYKPLKIISKHQADSGKTIVVIDNTAKEKLNSISLIIGNASVSRTADISGSDDGKKWYSMEEDIRLSRRNIDDTDKYVGTVFFPLITYNYIRLVIYNGKNDPLNIIEAGRYADVKTNAYDSLTTKNPEEKFIQKDSSDGYSYIRIHNPIAFHIDKIILNVTGPKFFRRNIDVIVPYGITSAYTITSSSTFSLDVPVFKANDWLIKLYNNDSPPLKIADIATTQGLKYIVMWLDSGKTYHLEMNNPSAVAPQYDLQNFKDSIPKNVMPLTYSAIENIAIASVSPNTSIFKQSWLWAVIVLVLAVLVYFTWQLTKEVAKK